MLKRIAIISTTVICILVESGKIQAQEDYRFDIGGGVGMTGYLGDANTSTLFKRPSWDIELLFRYIATTRWNFKTNFFVGGLSGNSADMLNVFPTGQDYKFTTIFYELSELAEFNFFSYGIGETYLHLKRFTPYLAGGLGLTAWNVSGYSGVAFTLPFGIGFRYKPSKRLNLGLEFLMKKTFTDRLDGPDLQDPTGIKSSFMKNTDWYSTLTFTVSYEFSKRCATCNYKD
ncbi:MAG: outer membrane beta-barrel protein [Muribaculaceae bacterium]|nr:outer membrane beta-barrel protein [Muribaculaceae bacterium]